MTAYYFILLTWFGGGYVSGYNAVQFGPFETRLQCEQVQQWVTRRPEGENRRLTISNCWMYKP